MRPWQPGPAKSRRTRFSSSALPLKRTRLRWNGRIMPSPFGGAKNGIRSILTKRAGPSLLIAPVGKFSEPYELSACCALCHQSPDFFNVCIISEIVDQHSIYYRHKETCFLQSRGDWSPVHTGMFHDDSNIHSNSLSVETSFFKSLFAWRTSKGRITISPPDRRTAVANLLTSVNSLNKKSSKIYCREQLSIRQL